MTAITAINATLVKELRNKTGVGMMDCKKALVETGGNLEEAVAWLRATGIWKAAEKAARIAAEGLVGLVVKGNEGAIAELNTETDFVARNDMFKGAAAAFPRIALAVGGDHDKLLNAPAPDGDGTVSDLITRLIATLGENMQLRRSAFVSVGRGVIAPYVHSAAAPGVGRVGVLVALESAGDRDVLSEIGHQLAMHVAASAPTWVSVADIPTEVVAKKREALTEQAMDTGKPAPVVDKMIQGRLRRFYDEAVFLRQAFVLDPQQTVEQALRAAEHGAGAPITIANFVRFKTGEGV